MEYIDYNTLNYIKKYNDLNGIKPNAEDIIIINDTLEVAIMKFNRWYNKLFSFAQGDYRDLCGFTRLNNTFLNIIKDIDDDKFLNHMKFKITNKEIKNKEIEILIP